MPKFNHEAELYRLAAHTMALETILVHFMEALTHVGGIHPHVVRVTFEQALNTAAGVGDNMSGTVADIHGTRIREMIQTIGASVQLPS